MVDARARRRAGPSAKSARMRSALAASRRKSSSSARCVVQLVEERQQLERLRVEALVDAADAAQVARGRCARSRSMSGYCTLTATSRPSRRRARCTCASDADGDRRALEAREHGVERLARARARRPRASPRRAAAARASWHCLQRLDELGREHVRARRDRLTDLDHARRAARARCAKIASRVALRGSRRELRVGRLRDGRAAAATSAGIL